MKYVPYRFIINATGHPAITVPLGLNKSGLPIGIQIIGRYYSEPELLQLAQQVEAIIPRFIKPRSL